MKELKYTAIEPGKLSSWKEIARWEITKWLLLDGYDEEINNTTMMNDYMGPFTKFLYHFASLCQCGWGVMIDFNEYHQRVFLPNHYYKWMHKLRDDILIEMKDEYAIEQRMKIIQTQRVALLDKHGLFGGGPALNQKFDALNKEYDNLELLLK